MNVITDICNNNIAKGHQNKSDGCHRHICLCVSVSMADEPHHFSNKQQ